MKKRFVQDLIPGDMVVAVKRLDPRGADVQPGTLGIVFQDAETVEVGFSEINYGPLVRWHTGGVCNVYGGEVSHVETLHWDPSPVRR